MNKVPILILNATTLNTCHTWQFTATFMGEPPVRTAVFAETNGLSGKGCFDLQYGRIELMADYGSASGDWDIHQAAEFAKRAGFPVTEDQQPAEFGTPPASLRCDGAALYAGWYSLNHY